MRRKKTVKRSTKRRVVTRKSSPGSARRNQFPSISLRRIIIFGSLSIFLFVFIVLPNKRSISQSVAGVSIIRPFFSQATISWQKVDGADHYNIYYKQASEYDYTNAVRNIPSDITHYTISHLKKGASYQYKISAVNVIGEEFWWSPELDMTNIESM